MGQFALVGGAVAGVIGKTLVDAALESQKVMKQTEAIIAATGSAAGMTGKDISDLANRLSLKTGIDDEAIQTSMNLLLTFKQVRNETGLGNDVFNRASQAALDLGNVFGSTDAAAKMLGKALSNPIKGISALARAGVNFTDAQKEQIKTLVESGRVLDAQKIILQEVESQVGGTAAATATDFDRMRVAVGNIAEDLGTLLLPALESVSRFVTNKIMPIFQRFTDIVGEQGLGAGLDYLGKKGMQAIQDLSGWGAVVYGIVAAVTALKVATVAYTVAQGLASVAAVAFGVAWNATGIGLIVSGFALLVVGITAAYVKFEGFRNVVHSVVNGVVGYFEFMANIWRQVINVIIRGYNRLPFVKDVDLLGEFKFGRMGGADAPTGADKSRFDFVPMAKGGIVNKPTLAMIGEGGESEAVIPLSRMKDFGMGGGTTVNIHVNGGDPQSVVNALRTYMRQNGSVPIRVSNIY
jgi:hypothetical protein